ncbi:MAG: hypothetical protein BroJett024_41440 [Alphaproteobacteria bacterium]|nr:MAG: hypothetical protein BroJett024_41440 [Alphaproteobacteria bacterium]
MTREIIQRPHAERRQQVLDYLRLRGEPASLAQIGEAIGLTHSSMVRLVEGLVAEGVVVRAGLTPPTHRAGRRGVLWALPGGMSGVEQGGGEDGSPVMDWTARQAVATTDLPHRAISQAAREAARAGR